MAGRGLQCSHPPCSWNSERDQLQVPAEGLLVLSEALWRSSFAGDIGAQSGGALPVPGSWTVTHGPGSHPRGLKAPCSVTRPEGTAGSCVSYWWAHEIVPVLTPSSWPPRVWQRWGLEFGRACCMVSQEDGPLPAEQTHLTLLSPLCQLSCFLCPVGRLLHPVFSPGPEAGRPVTFPGMRCSWTGNDSLRATQPP